MKLDNFETITTDLFDFQIAVTHIHDLYSVIGSHLNSNRRNRVYFIVRDVQRRKKEKNSKNKNKNLNRMSFREFHDLNTQTDRHTRFWREK